MVDEVETTLQTPRRARITAAHSHEPVHATQLPVDAILRTTHIETSVDNVDSNKYRGLGHHGNPWDDHVWVRTDESHMMTTIPWKLYQAGLGTHLCR